MKEQKNSMNYDRDTAYWDSYYKKNESAKPSQFAQSIIKSLKSETDLLELGCGNGRDSLFFVQNGLKVTAIDASKQAIDLLKKKNIEDADFICGDFVCLPKHYKNKFEYCYSRFSIHAISKEQELLTIENVYEALKHGGKFFIEVRSVNDEIYGKGLKVARDSYIFENHFRRFIRKDELEGELKKYGFKIEYSEESRGFAPFNGEDPLILRIIAEKCNVE